MAIVTTIQVPAETRLTITANEVTQGRYLRISEPGDPTQYTPISIGPNETVEIGPFNDSRRYRLTSVIGKLIYQLNFDGLDGTTSEEIINALSGANLTLVTPANNDQILIKDSSDGGILKAITVQALVDLVGAGGGPSSSIAQDITMPGHSYIIGDVLRLSGSMLVKSLADSPSNAEAIGIVTNVDGDDFTITTQGKINLPGATLNPGSVYFLSDTVSGGYTNTPPYLPGTVIKPLFVADSTTSAYMQNYLGVHND